MPKLNDREYRSLMMFDSKASGDKRLDSTHYVEGYAARYEPYVLWEDSDGDIYEEFERGCFDGCDMSDVIFQLNHSGTVYARMSNGTLIVEPNDNGLFVAADLSKTTAARSRYEEINTGMITKMSWGFLPGEYSYNPETRTIKHTKIKKIFDVSMVSIPANDATDIHSRSALIDGEIERATQELREREEAKIKLKLKLKLGGF